MTRGMFRLKQFLNVWADRLKTSSFAQGTAVLSTGTLIAEGIVVFSTPALSRLFNPDDFGLLALFSAIVTICATIITLRYEMRIVPAKTDHEAKSIFLLAVVLALFLGICLSLLSLFIPNNIKILMGIDKLGHWLTIALLISIITALTTTFGYWFNRYGEYKKLSLLRIIQASLIATCSLIAGLISLKNGLLYALAIASVIALFPFLLAGQSSLNSIKGPSCLMNTAKNNRRAPAYLLPAAIMDVVSMQLPFFLISAWFTTELTGHYRMAWMILALPGSLIGAAVAKVFFQRYSILWPDAMRAKKFMIRILKALALIGIGPMVIILLFGDTLFVFILGDAWRESGIMAKYLAPMVFAMFVSSPISTAYIVMRMEKANMIFGTITMFTRPISFYLGYIFNNIYLAIASFTIIEILTIIGFQSYLFRKLTQSQPIDYDKEKSK